MTTTASDSSRLQFLVEAGITIASGLDLDRMLERIVELACRLTDARYGALGVIDPSGRRLERFITHGIDAETRRAIGPEPTGKGILGVLITDARSLRLADIGADPRSVGFPDHHPPMCTFLGVPVKAGESVFGNLYLTEKVDGEFTAIDEQLVTMLAAQAGVAIENAKDVRRVEEARGDPGAGGDPTRRRCRDQRRDPVRTTDRTGTRPDRRPVAAERRLPPRLRRTRRPGLGHDSGRGGCRTRRRRDPRGRGSALGVEGGNGPGRAPDGGRSRPPRPTPR